MLKLDGNDIYRDGSRVGYVEEYRVYGNTGDKLGYYEDGHVYGRDGDKIAYIDGDNLYSGDRKVSMNYVSENVEGGLLSALGKAAVYVLIGI